MKLKPIEPGMIIHCDTEEKAKQLINWAFENGFRWYGDSTKRNINWYVYGNQTCYRFMENKEIVYANYKYYRTGIAEFSDLIIPELTVEELFDIMAEMHTECYGKVDGCLGCPIITVAEHCDADCFGRNAKAIIEICEQWKADHEKKEPEVEWIFKGVADTAVATEIEFFNTENEAREWCERRTIETGLGYAYIPVCRVKAVE